MPEGCKSPSVLMQVESHRHQRVCFNAPEPPHRKRNPTESAAKRLVHDPLQAKGHRLYRVEEASSDGDERESNQERYALKIPQKSRQTS